VPGDAAADGAHDGVVAGIMTRDRARRAARKAADRRRRSRSQHGDKAEAQSERRTDKNFMNLHLKTSIDALSAGHGERAEIHVRGQI